MQVKKWTDENYVKVYELARGGMSEQKMAEALGTTVTTFRKWREKNPAFESAISQGKDRDKQNGNASFLGYVYKRLPKDLRILWDEINQIDRETNSVKRIEAIFREKGENVRKSLFLHALVSCNFNASEACRKVNITKNMMEAWLRKDLDFSVLIDEMIWHKKNFFESALFKSAKKGDIHAIIFGNKAYNADRGLNPGKHVEVSGTIEHNHNVVGIDVLKKLPIEIRKQLLEAVEAHEAEQLAITNAIDVETTDAAD